MRLFPSSKIFLEIGPLTITWYAILVMGAAWLCYRLCIREYKKMGYSEEIFEDFFLIMLPVAFIGARLYYVIFEWESFISEPIRIFYIWEGGLAIHGGVIASILYGLYYFRKKGIDPLRIGDTAFPYVMLAQVIGRWGNFVNKEAYGAIVNEEFFRFFPDFIKDGMYINGFYRQPTFLFEGIGNLIGFILIKFVYSKHGRKKRGDMMYAYFMWYGMVRFMVEGMRTDSLMLGPIRVAQLISLLGILLGLLGMTGVLDKVFKNIYPFKKNKPVIIFDLDGTLVDTKELIFESFRYTFKELKPEYTLSEEELNSFLGPTLKQSFSKYFDEDMVDTCIKTYRDHNKAVHDDYVKEVPGAKALLKYLKENDYDVCVASNKLASVVKHGLDFCELTPYVDCVVGCDNVLEPKPSPDCIIECCKRIIRGTDDVVYVGDAVSDIEAAKNMACFSVALCFDKDKKEALLQAKPCRAIDSLDEIIPMLKEDIVWSDTGIV